MNTLLYILSFMILAYETIVYFKPHLKYPSPSLLILAMDGLYCIYTILIWVFISYHHAAAIIIMSCLSSYITSLHQTNNAWVRVDSAVCYFVILDLIITQFP